MTTVGSATIELRGDATHFERTMARAFTQFKQVGQGVASLDKGLVRAEQNLYRFSRNLRSVGRGLTTGVTLPLVAVGAGAVKAFAGFDQAMTESTAIMGDVSKAMRTDMVDAARAVGRETAISATQAAKSYFFLASAGLDAAQSIAALPQVAAFAQAGMFDMSKATDLATDAQSALGLTSKDAQENLLGMTRVTDVLVKANTLANASVEQFSTALTTEAGAAMKTFNIDVEEGVAVLAAFADQGIKGQTAGSGYSRILRLMSAAAVNNAGAMKKLGIEFFDAEGNMRNMADIVENLETAFAGMSDEQRTAELQSIGFTARVQGMLLPLLGTSKAIREYESGLRDAAGTTRDVAGKQMESFSAQMKRVGNNIVIAAQQIGEQLAPTIGKLADLTGKLATRIGNLNPTVIKLGLVFAGIAASLGPLLLALSGILGTLGSLAMIANTAIGASALGGLGALLATGGPIVAGAIAAAAAIGFVVVKLTESGREAKKAREELDRFRESLGKPVTIDMVRDFNVQASLAAVKVAELRERIDAALDVGNVRLAQDLRGKLEDAQGELERFKFRASQIGKLKIETEATVRAKIEVEEQNLTATLNRIREVEEKLKRLPEGRLRSSQESLLDRLNSRASELSSNLNTLEGDLQTFTQSAGEARAAVASPDSAIYTDEELKKMREQANIAARIRHAVVSAERDFFERRFRAPDFSAIGGKAFRGQTIAVELDLDFVQKLGAPNINIPDLSILTPDQRQKFIDGVPFDELTGKIKSFGTHTKELMFGVGEDLVTGIIQGTLDMGDILKRFLIGFAGRFILGPLAGALGIFSPSRVTRGFGVDLGAGLVIGMSGMESSVRQAALALASAAIVSLPTPAIAAPDVSAPVMPDLAAVQQVSIEILPIDTDHVLRDLAALRSDARRQVLELGVTTVPPTLALSPASSRATAATTLSAPAAATSTAANQPLNIYIPDPWADPTAFARSPAGQRYYRVADDTATQMGHRRG